MRAIPGGSAQRVARRIGLLDSLAAIYTTREELDAYAVRLDDGRSSKQKRR